MELCRRNAGRFLSSARSSIKPCSSQILRLDSCRALSTDTARRSGSNSSVNDDEINFFSRLSAQWWDEKGEFGLLHKMNPVRVSYIRDKVMEISREDGIEEVGVKAKVLEGLDVIDVGCGGGLLSEVSTKFSAFGGTA